jgi:hypothetical protein
VCTSILIDDVRVRAARGDEFAKRLAEHWVYPLEMMFVTSSGVLISKLNSYEDFPGMHPDVVAPPHAAHQALQDEHSHTAIFLNHLARHFGKEQSAGARQPEKETR